VLKIDLSWPILRGMADTKNLHLIAYDFVDCDVVPRSKHEFAGIFDQSNSSAGRECTQPRDASKNGLSDAASGRRIVFTDVLDNVSEIGSR